MSSNTIYLFLLLLLLYICLQSGDTYVSNHDVNPSNCCLSRSPTALNTVIWHLSASQLACHMPLRFDWGLLHSSAPLPCWWVISDSVSGTKEETQAVKTTPYSCFCKQSPDNAHLLPTKGNHSHATPSSNWNQSYWNQPSATCCIVEFLHVTILRVKNLASKCHVCSANYAAKLVTPNVPLPVMSPNLIRNQFQAKPADL